MYFHLFFRKHKLTFYFHFAEEGSEEEQEDIPVVDAVFGIEEHQDDPDDTMDSLQQGLEMMDLGGRPSNLPPTTPGLFVIPPRSYLNVSEGRRYVRI